MYHKIGTLAKRFGITPQALRFYEGNGLLAPDHPPESGERRYQASRFKNLYSIRRYHDLGYSQEERPRKSGFCIEEKMAQRLGMPRGPHTVETPGGRRAVHTVTALDRYPITTEDFLGYALAYAQERGLTLSGAAGRCLAKTGEDRCRDQRYPKAVYYEYWLLIEE